MSLSWHHRKARLASLLKSRGDEEADGTALDRLLHGQSIIGKTAKTIEIDALRFQDKDLVTVGTLEYGQFGVIDLVNCRLDGRVYVRKTIQKRLALRTRDQCFPQFERDILLQAVKTDSRWAPHLLCAFQNDLHLNLIMDYIEGGTLWDTLESSPHNGKITETDLMWWTPQAVSAIHWCHTQGFAHRDIKPHNFVLTPEAHLLLIDFGSAAPLLPPANDGTQLLPKRYCLVPCGTCDYISPEILRTHEEALVALEMEDDDDIVLEHRQAESDGYGVETDWWSLGAMLYEMAYGVAPFFASDIRQTYLRIMNHERSLRFDKSSNISHKYQHFLRRLLTSAENRLGRKSILEITEHPVFETVDWSNLHTQTTPSSLHLPQFIYTEPNAAQNQGVAQELHEESISQAFAFSALFQSSKVSTSPGVSMSRPASSPLSATSQRSDHSSSFIGFSWGPQKDAFPSESLVVPPAAATPFSVRLPSMHLTPGQTYPLPASNSNGTFSTPLAANRFFSTPIRPYAPSTPFQTGTIRRTSTNRRTAPRRTMSDREAMKQLVDCVGMSARKKVLESGRKPRVLTTSFSRGIGSLRRGKELRFDTSASPIPDPDFQSARIANLAPLTINTEAMYSASEAEVTDSEGPPSPSPRPSSAMSRSGTPTFTMAMTGRSGTPSLTHTFSRGSSSLLLSARTASFVGNTHALREGTLTANKELPIVDSSTNSTSLLREMEARHEKLMKDIYDIEERLERATSFIQS